MDSTYGEFQGTELDPSLDFDYDDEENDLPQILGLAAVVAALVGAVLVFIGRRRQPTVAERAQDILDTATKEGSKTLKAGSKSLKAASKSASKVVADARLGELLDEALDRARKAGAGADLTEILTEARHKASKAVDSVDLGKAYKSARKEAAVATAELGALLGEALDKARDASSRIDISGLGDAAGEVRKHAAKVAANGHLPEIDVQKAGGFLDDLREKLVEAIESVRSDIAPKVMDTLKDDVLPSVQETAQQVAHKVQEDVVPAAQGAVEKLRDDVIPGAQERAGRLAEEYDVAPRARKVASAATEGAGTLTNVLRTVAMAVLEKMIEDILPGAKKAGSRAVKTAREDVIPAAAGTAGDAAQKVREEVFPRVGAAAAQAPDLLSDILNLAREKASEAFDKAQPMVSDATHSAKGAVSDAAHSAKDMAGSGKHGVTGAVSSAGRGVKGAVGGAVGATTSATKEFTGILFWLAMLGGLILLVFVPEREKQEEIWRNIRQFLGEVREMWQDLQGPAPEYDNPSSTHTM